MMGYWTIEFTIVRNSLEDYDYSLHTILVVENLNFCSD